MSVSLGDFVLESLFCSQRLWILNLFRPTLSYGPQTGRFISSQNPVTSARELYRLLSAIREL